MAAIVTGAASGGALLCLVLFASYTLPRGPTGAFSNIALVAAAAALATAAGVAFTLARATLGAWRARLAAMVAVAGAALVTVLTTPADIALGRSGLLVLAALCIGLIALAYRVHGRRSG